MTEVVVYVRLLDAGTDVWRPVNAIRRGDHVVELLAPMLPDADEPWEFPPGSLVRTEPRTFAQSHGTESRDVVIGLAADLTRP